MIQLLNISVDHLLHLILASTAIETTKQGKVQSNMTWEMYAVSNCFRLPYFYTLCWFHANSQWMFTFSLSVFCGCVNIIKNFHCVFYICGGSLLTLIILWWHGSLEDLCEGLQPLFLLPLLLAHEDKASSWRPHRDATLPLVSPSVLGFTLLHWVAFVHCADENDP